MHGYYRENFYKSTGLVGLPRDEWPHEKWLNIKPEVARALKVHRRTGRFSLPFRCFTFSDQRFSTFFFISGAARPACRVENTDYSQQLVTMQRLMSARLKDLLAKGCDGVVPNNIGMRASSEEWQLLRVGPENCLFCFHRQIAMTM